jgi:rod shape determining protein RodA
MNRIWRFCVQFYKKTDKLLLTLCLVSSVFSAALLWGIYLSGYIKLRTFFVQVLASLIGLAAACVISLFDYRTLAGLWKLYLPAAVGLVVLTYFVGIQRAEYIDDKAWLVIPLTSMTFQPSEVLKLAFVLSFALHLERVREFVNDPRTLAGLCLHGALPILMIVGQGDHGTAMVFAAICVGMMFAAGVGLRYAAAAVAAAAAISPLVWTFLLDNDKRGRIMTVFNPASDPTGSGWQQSLGLTAIGSGQIWGKGIFSGSHQYVPEMHNDFIFAFAGEATGFVGSAAIVALLALICLGILLNARRAKDPLGRFICVGVFGIIAFQSIWGIGMCLSLLPVAGLTLPLFSAGGTSVVLTWAGIGLVLSVRRHSSSALFDDR